MTEVPWDYAAFIRNNPSSSVIVRMEDGTYCGCDIDGELMADSVVLADRSVVERTPENLAKPLWHPDDYDRCGCKGLEEHAKAMGTWPLLAIPKEPYGDPHS